MYFIIYSRKLKSKRTLKSRSSSAVINHVTRDTKVTRIPRTETVRSYSFVNRNISIRIFFLVKPLGQNMFSLTFLLKSVIFYVTFFHSFLFISGDKKINQGKRILVRRPCVTNKRVLIFKLFHIR